MNTTIRTISIFISLSILAYFGYDMYNKTQNEQIWSHQPLYFLSTFWLLWVILRWNTYSNKGQNNDFLLLSTLSGIVLTLGFPNFSSTFLMFVGFIPLLWVEHQISEAKKKGENPTRFFKYAYHTFVVWNILSTWWVANAALAPAFIAIWLNAFFMAIPFWAFHKIKEKTNRSILSYCLLPAFWLTFEYIHLRWDISWTWLNLGNAFAEKPSWIQWYEFTGVFGGAIWVWASNLLLFKTFIVYKEKQKIPTLQGVAGLAVLILPILISMLIQKNINIQDGKAFNTLVLQPNYEPHYEKFTIDDKVQLEKFVSLTKTKLNSKTDFIVFPETSFGNYEVATLSQEPTILQLKTVLNAFPKANLITGLDLHKIYYTKPNNTTARKSLRSDVYYDTYNAGAQIATNAREIPLYYKSKLVPGPEFLPFEKALFFLKPIFDQMGGSTGSCVTQVQRTNFMNEEGIKVAPVICYESIFGEYCTGYIKNGANAIFIMTNDGWWNDTPGYLQHLKFASLRAIETRRWIARSANTGSSGFIDPIGKIHDATQYGIDAAEEKTIYARTGETFYVRFGDWIGVLAMIFAAMGLLYAFLKPSKRSTN